MHAANIAGVKGYLKVLLGEGQLDDFIALPALRDGVNVVIEWDFSEPERRIIAEGGRVRMIQVIGTGAFPPIMMKVVDTDEMLQLETVS